jgi:hypothetical protein
MGETTQPPIAVPTPARRRLDLASLDDVLGDIRKLHEGGYTKAGQWNLAQICLHCAKPMDMCIDGFSFKANFVVRLAVKILIKKSFFRDRKIQPGLKAPAGFVIEPDADEASAIGNMETAIKRFQDHKQASRGWRPHPVFGTFSADQWEQFHIIHCMHHLSFLVDQ